MPYRGIRSEATARITAIAPPVNRLNAIDDAPPRARIDGSGLTGSPAHPMMSDRC
jgi:hypothetical protein